MGFFSLLQLTFFSAFDHFNSSAIISTITGKASSAACTFKNASRVLLAKTSTAVAAYSLVAYRTWQRHNSPKSRFPFQRNFTSNPPLLQFTFTMIIVYILYLGMDVRKFTVNPSTNNRPPFSCQGC